MNVSKYAVLLTVAEVGSLTAAGEKLGYTQSGVSHIIANLESEFGFPLFIRGKGGAALTRDGEKIIESVRNLICAREALTQVADEIKGLRSGRVRVGMFSSVAVHWAPDIICGFNKLYPNIEIEIFAGLYDEIENRITSEQIDCGFITKQTHTNLNFIELMQDRLLAVVPKGHIFETFSALPLKLIERENFIIPGEGSNYDLGQIFKANGIQPNVRYALSDDYAAIAMVERKIGITILPELVLTGRDAGVTALELSPACHRNIGIVTGSGRNISPATKAFTEFVKKWVSNRID